MKTLQFDQYGPPDSLKLAEVEIPKPGKNEVLVKIKAASINSWDWDLLHGRPFVNKLIAGFKSPHRIKTLGCDIAGIVEETGEEVPNFSPGDEVLADLCACGMGAFAEYVCVPEKVLTAKPKALGFSEAACLPQAGVMALQSLREIRPMKPGERVLINGAGGSVGNLFIQLACNMNLEVTAVDRKDKLETLKKLGAREVIDFEEQDYTKLDKQFDLVVDVVASRRVKMHKKALTPGGVFAMVGGKSIIIVQHMLLGSIASVFSSRKVKILAHKPNKALAELAQLTANGKIAPVIDATYPLKDVQKALKHFGSNTFVGKIVIEMS